MSEEIPDRKQWVLQNDDPNIGWCELGYYDSLGEAQIRLKNIIVNYPKWPFRIVEQTISSKVVEG